MATRDTGGQQKATRSREETDEVEASVDTEVAERHKEMTEDVDSILDEIDEVLEANPRNSLGSTYKKGVSETLWFRKSRRWMPKFCRDCGEDRPLPSSRRTQSLGTGWLLLP